MFPGNIPVRFYLVKRKISVVCIIILCPIKIICFWVYKILHNLSYEQKFQIKFQLFAKNTHAHAGTNNTTILDGTCLKQMKIMSQERKLLRC